MTTYQSKLISDIEHVEAQLQRALANFIDVVQVANDITIRWMQSVLHDVLLQAYIEQILMEFSIHYNSWTPIDPHNYFEIRCDFGPRCDKPIYMMVYIDSTSNEAIAPKVSGCSITHPPKPGQIDYVDDQEDCVDYQAYDYAMRFIGPQ